MAYTIAIVVAAAQSSIVAAAPAPDQPASAATSFMVRIFPPVAEPAAGALTTLLPLAMRTTVTPPAGGADAATKARLQQYYNVLIEKLRAVPGLVLVGEKPAGGVSIPGYEITFRLAEDWKGVQIDATSVRSPSGNKLTWRAFESLPALTPRLTALWDPVQENPERDMDAFVESMRLTLFPPDRALLDKKMSEFRDPQLDPNLRRLALNRLQQADRRRDSPGNQTEDTYQPDPALVSAVIEVATKSSDPGMRRLGWATVSALTRSRIDPVVLVAPAARALGGETDLLVQLALVNFLSANLRIPAARTALESVAFDDADKDRQELVRMAARRVLDSGRGWSDYVVAKLKEPQVPDSERIALINYVSSIAGTINSLQGFTVMRLNEADEHALASLLKPPSSTEVAVAASGVLGLAGGAVAREEFAEFLRKGTGQPGADTKVRASAIWALALSLRLRPELRPLFEDIKARDSDPALREAAGQALDQTK